MCDACAYGLANPDPTKTSMSMGQMRARMRRREQVPTVTVGRSKVGLKGAITKPAPAATRRSYPTRPGSPWGRGLVGVRWALDPGRR
jgi:hypothetical protein